MKQFSKFVGLDVHKETIAVAVAEADGGNGTTGTGVKLFSATNTLAALTEQLSHASPSARESGGIPAAHRATWAQPCGSRWATIASASR